MSISTKNEMIAPTIDAVNLTYKQIFPTREIAETVNGVTITPNGVAKNTISFSRKEDMMVMCLSAFVHDYVHDYNLGTMHNRVIKGNIMRSNPDVPSLFESLGIKIANKTFKIMSYSVGGHRDISMYNDEQFEDVPSRDINKTNFVSYLNSKEELISQRGGDTPSIQPMELVSPSELKFKPALGEGINEDIKEENEDVTISSLSEIENQDSVKSDTFGELQNLLVIPTIKGLDFNKIVEIFEKNADFLAFHSSLNTFIVTYLGYDPTMEEKKEENKNSIMNKSIVSSLNYIINDFDESTKEGTLDANESEFYRDMFKLILLSYNTIMNKTNTDFKKNVLDVLNSSEVLYQFILFYISYLSVENYSKIEEMITQKGGDGEDVENDEIEMEDNALEGEEIGPVEDYSPLLPAVQKQKTLVPEYVFITHNNLLTTIARGMFIKLGIWKQIFFPDRTPRPEEYIFGFDQMNQISYDKLVELYPIDHSLPNGHRNNELLILEILILKRLLLEMSPSKTLTFGAKIDDDLKDYMDAFYYDYYIKNSALSYKPEVPIDPEVELNPDINVELDEAEQQKFQSEAEEMFDMCEEDCYNDGSVDSDGSYGQYGGGQCFGKQKGPNGECIENVSNPVNSNIVELQDIEPSEIPENFESVSNEVQEVVEEVAPEVVEEVAPEVVEEVAPEVVEAVAPEVVEAVAPEVVAQGVAAEPAQLSNAKSIQELRAPNIPILFDKLKKMYQNNIYTIKQLQASEIEPIMIGDKTVNNLYELLQLNETLMQRTGTNFKVPAPKLKFVINNAANVGSNINGSKLFYLNSFGSVITSSVKEIKDRVFKDGVVNNVELTNYISEIEAQLNQLYDNLDKLYIVPMKDLNAKKRAKNMTLREFDELQIKTHERKKLEREEITPLENKLFLLNLLKNTPDEFRDFEENHNKWFKDCQALFGLYRNLQRGTFCPTSSMMDAMDNCSLKYNTTEPKEVGTSYSEIIYKDEATNTSISFGGVVLNYNQVINDNEELTAKIYYELECNDEANGQINDLVKISTLGIKVSESNDLKARVAYQGVVNKIKQLYDNPIPNENIIEEEVIELEGEPIEIEPVKRTKQQKADDRQILLIKNMWSNLQYQYNRNNFNELLSATALKTMGDYLQECQSCFKWGGYVNSYEAFPEGLTNESGMFSFDSIKDSLIYRSVNKGGAVIPYDERGNALRLGIQGDRPSGFRSIYMLLNGKEAVNDQAITGYMFTSSTQNPSRTLLVSRNMNRSNSNQLEGNVIFVTRELQTPNKDNLLKELEFLNVKDKTRKVEGIDVAPDITGATIEGTPKLQRSELVKNPNTKIERNKNSKYKDWFDYEKDFEIQQQETELEIDETDREREMRMRREERNRKAAEEAAAQSAERMAASIVKRQETSAEKTEAKNKISEINSKIDEEQTKIADDLNRVQTELNQKRELLTSSAGPRTPIGRIMADIERNKNELQNETKKTAKTTRSIEQKEKNITRLEQEINRIQTELDNNPNYAEISELKSLISSLEDQENQLLVPITQLEEEKRAWEKKARAKKGGTVSNKKKHVHKKTKRRLKLKNKLTKKHIRSLKIPKITRKNLQN